MLGSKRIFIVLLILRPGSFEVVGTDFLARIAHLIKKKENYRVLTVEVNGGRWGVVPASEHQEILVALASLIRAQRYEMALTILDNELGGGC